MQTSMTLASDGYQIPTYVWDVPNPRAIVQILHGLSEHAARYGKVAEALNAAGYAAYAHDHRGHGPHAELAGSFGEGDGWQRVIDDVATIGSRAKLEHPGLPLVLLGHSMGSFVARAFAIGRSAEIAGLVIIGTGAGQGLLGAIGRLVASVQARLLGRTKPAKLLNRLAFGGFNTQFRPSRTPFDWLSRDPEQVDAYIADPYCGRVPKVGLFSDMLGGLAALNDEAEVAKVRTDLHIYIFSGQADPVGDAGRGVQAVRDQYERCGVADLSLKLYPGARHEVLNETNAAQVVADLVAWLQARF